MPRVDNLATFICRLSWNLGASTSWNPQGLYRPVQGLLYLSCMTRFTLIHLDQMRQDTNKAFTRYLSHVDKSLGDSKSNHVHSYRPHFLLAHLAQIHVFPYAPPRYHFPCFPLALCSNGQFLWRRIVIFHVAFLHWQRITFHPAEYDDIFSSQICPFHMHRPLWSPRLSVSIPHQVTAFVIII